MNITNDINADGVRQLSFEFTHAGEVIGGVLWRPHRASRPLPILLSAHGGGLHKLYPPLVAYAKSCAVELDCAVVAIDAPGHGARSDPERMAALSDKVQRQLRSGEGLAGAALDDMLAAASQAASEWQVALDLLLTLDDIDPQAKVGLIGISMGAMTGLLLAARDVRISAAVIALAGARDAARTLEQAARRISAPVQFVMQWDDEFIPRSDTLALFDALASPEKILHANPGAHTSIPMHERLGWKAFLQRHLN